MNMTWEWVAGFFEGEGCITWYEPKKRGGRQGVGARAIIGQKCKEPLVAIQQFLLQQGIVNPLLYLRKPWAGALGKASPTWMLTIQRRDDVLLFLTAIAPLLFQKQEKARLVIHKIRALQARTSCSIAQASTLRAKGMKWHEIARRMKVNFTTLKNMLAGAGVAIEAESTKAETKRRAMVNAKASGNCIACFKPRRANGTAHHCRKCADKANAGKRARRLK